MIRLNLTDEQYKKLKHLSERFTGYEGDPDINNLIDIIQEKERKIYRHNAMTIYHTTQDEDTKKIAKELYNESIREEY